MDLMQHITGFVVTTVSRCASSMLNRYEMKEKILSLCKQVKTSRLLFRMGLRTY